MRDGGGGQTHRGTLPDSAGVCCCCSSVCAREMQVEAVAVTTAGLRVAGGWRAASGPEPAWTPSAELRQRGPPAAAAWLRRLRGRHQPRPCGNPTPQIKADSSKKPTFGRERQVSTPANRRGSVGLGGQLWGGQRLSVVVWRRQLEGRRVVGQGRPSREDAVVDELLFDQAGWGGRHTHGQPALPTIPMGSRGRSR